MAQVGITGVPIVALAGTNSAGNVGWRTPYLHHSAYRGTTAVLIETAIEGGASTYSGTALDYSLALIAGRVCRHRISSPGVSSDWSNPASSFGRPFSLFRKNATKTRWGAARASLPLPRTSIPPKGFRASVEPFGNALPACGGTN